MQQDRDKNKNKNQDPQDNNPIRITGLSFEGNLWGSDPRGRNRSGNFRRNRNHQALDFTGGQQETRKNKKAQIPQIYAHKSQFTKSGDEVSP